MCTYVVEVLHGRKDVDEKGFVPSGYEIWTTLENFEDCEQKLFAAHAGTTQSDNYEF